jgi:hypothetical protein
VAQGREAELAAAAQIGGSRVTLQVRATRELVEGALRSVSGLQKWDAADEPGGLLRLHVAFDSDQRESLVAALVTAGVGVRRIVEDESELESIFLGLTQGAMA